MKNKSDKKPLINKDPDNLPLKRRRNPEQKRADLVKVLVDYGFPKRKAKRIAKNRKVIKRSIADTIKPVLEFLESKVHTKKKTIKIVSKCPRLFSSDKETLERRYNILDARIPEFVKHVISENPSVLAYSDSSIIKRLDVFDEVAYKVGMQKLLSNPIRLTFSPETIKRRFEFIKSRKGFSVYYLFMTKKRFEKRFKVCL